MVDVDFLKQLINTMEESIILLEEAINKKNTERANRLRTFIFDIHRQINNHILGKNV